MLEEFSQQLHEPDLAEIVANSNNSKKSGRSNPQEDL
jgi:hypothetical protein